MIFKALRLNEVPQERLDVGKKRDSRAGPGTFQYSELGEMRKNQKRRQKQQQVKDRKHLERVSWIPNRDSAIRKMQESPVSIGAEIQEDGLDSPVWSSLPSMMRQIPGKLEGSRPSTVRVAPSGPNKLEEEEQRWSTHACRFKNILQSYGDQDSEVQAKDEHID